jgi:lipoprotein-anchoring transpeptidase ErfK/SrfK
VINFQNPDQTQSKRTPGDEVNDYTGHVFKNYEPVPVYNVQRVQDTDWYLVGPDEWLPQRLVVRVIPNTTPPQGVTGDRWIEVNLLEQTLAVYDKRQLAFATVIATGAEPFWTKPGMFQIKQKLASTVMRGALDGGGDAYYLEDVPWTMYYDGARALHGAYWRSKMGYPQSHGCVNMTVGDSRWLFDWAVEGDWVYVWDPSGKTPTDPNLYSSGGY